MTLGHDDIRDLAAGFVLGALTGEEDAAVRDHLASCPEPHPEIAELGGTVPYLPESLAPVEPSPDLRARLLAAAAADRPATAAERPAPTAERPVPTTPRLEMARRPTIGTWVLRIAAVVAIVALGAWNFRLQDRLGQVEGDLAAATAYQRGVAAVLEVASETGASTAILRAADAGTAASGIAATGADGTVVISIRNLAPTRGSEVYEAWLIAGEAPPTPLGSFVVGAGGTGAFRGQASLAGPGAAVALTLEPGPGATTPTLPILTVGTLTAGA